MDVVSHPLKRYTFKISSLKRMNFLSIEKKLLTEMICPSGVKKERDLEGDDHVKQANYVDDDDDDDVDDDDGDG